MVLAVDAPWHVVGSIAGLRGLFPLEVLPSATA
jgi:hypothetical protein